MSDTFLFSREKTKEGEIKGEGEREGGEKGLGSKREGERKNDGTTGRSTKSAFFRSLTLQSKNSLGHWTSLVFS